MSDAHLHILRCHCTCNTHPSHLFLAGLFSGSLVSRGDWSRGLKTLTCPLASENGWKCLHQCGTNQEGDQSLPGLEKSFPQEFLHRNLEMRFVPAVRDLYQLSMGRDWSWPEMVGYLGSPCFPASVPPASREAAVEAEGLCAGPRPLSPVSLRGLGCRAAQSLCTRRNQTRQPRQKWPTNRKKDKKR